MQRELSIKDWIGFVAMIVGMFMAILDIQIVASSLKEIQAGLSASQDEITWVQTSYLIAEVIMIPLSGWLAKALSTRLFYTISAAIFTVMSVLCAFSWDLESMIVFRAIQGFFSGGMIPTVFSTIFTMFPKKMHSKITVLVGLVVTIAPTVGPILGGYLTEQYSWHYMFLINVIPGIAVSTLTYLLIDVDKPEFQLFKSIDFIGIFYIITCLGPLQYILEEGVKEDWFDSLKITVLSIISLISFILLIDRELKYQNPIIDFSSFKNKNFTAGCIFSFIIGSGMYSAVYLLPLYLGAVKGLNSFQIGMYVAVTGVFQFLSAPIAGILSSKVDLRIMLFVGFSLFGLGCYLDSFLTHDEGFMHLFLPQAVRGMSLMFCFLPINTITFGTLPPEQIKFASGLYNLTRNLGGAIMLAKINGYIVNHNKIYYAEMKQHISTGSLQFMQVFTMLKERLLSIGNNFSDVAAIRLYNNILLREALVISINDCFVILAIFFWASIIIMPFLEKPKEIDDSAVGH
ncbi:DHA2 family efflux MFS transporter permease subunit [Rickettsiales endosymbiont of Stachyamoeba lipophora]|uniref:DHA2 family efflux MFS transporter permease subunit n=1 Tax=Rickettsiales endosymbiont of Stachyamoeba lipophora TaxID=2486578 RepID=UPI000F648FA8|nr:DHA2 family efflux MFS transporter permease subunit [Rickettsiales endosymbiont of Stachyamoeba lipophora]AZL15580.1 DHA2 family efflux MFS transporter permease subunit [Rickettsiales endosymbiont of Stachyamoeba lipophora]